jgi:hypothetical protein
LPPLGFTGIDGAPHLALDLHKAFSNDTKRRLRPGGGDAAALARSQSRRGSNVAQDVPKPAVCSSLDAQATRLFFSKQKTERFHHLLDRSTCSLHHHRQETRAFLPSPTNLELEIPEPLLELPLRILAKTR